MVARQIFSSPFNRRLLRDGLYGNILKRRQPIKPQKQPGEMKARFQGERALRWKRMMKTPQPKLTNPRPEERSHQR